MKENGEGFHFLFFFTLCSLFSDADRADHSLLCHLLVAFAPAEWPRAAIIIPGPSVHKSTDEQSLFFEVSEYLSLFYIRSFSFAVTD
jgi:hypothetical protein